MPQSQPHDEFLELCAISTSGRLSPEEQRKLEEHLAVCRSCREALDQYEKVVDEAIPRIAASETDDDVGPGPGWSQAKAEKEFFRRRAERNKAGEKKAEGKTAGHSGSGGFGVGAGRSLAERSREDRVPSYSSGASSISPSSVGPAPIGPSWRQVWSLYATGILLFVALGLYAYRVHLDRRAAHVSVPVQSTSESNLTASLEEQLSDIGHERALAQAEIRQRDQLIQDLRHRLTEESAEVAQMKRAQDPVVAEHEQLKDQHLKQDLGPDNTSREKLIDESKSAEEKLQAAERNSAALEAELEGLKQQSAKDAAREKVLSDKNSELSRLLEDREQALARQEELLAHDKDIRDLMGARDLYVAEVYDIARTGETKKPYGRVFYTRAKSLIFYAYDLDQETEARKTSSFQAWGRRGPDREQALNLGIFYEDNLARKRWILKCEDSKTLAEIDGVFVTIEPDGGSHKPSGKSLLFAYLKVSPNHP